MRALISRAMERVQSRASRGVISRALLVACSDAEDDPYVALGLVVYEDVRRRDADETSAALARSASMSKSSPVTVNASPA